MTTTPYPTAMEEELLMTTTPYPTAMEEEMLMTTTEYPNRRKNTTKCDMDNSGLPGYVTKCPPVTRPKLTKFKNKIKKFFYPNQSFNC